MVYVIIILIVLCIFTGFLFVSAQDELDLYKKKEKREEREAEEKERKEVERKAEERLLRIESKLLSRVYKLQVKKKGRK